MDEKNNDSNEEKESSDININPTIEINPELDVNNIIEQLQQQLQASLSINENINNENIVQIIQSVLESMHTSNIGINSDNGESVQIQLELEWLIPGAEDTEDNDIKFENCKEINEKVCKFEKIKEGDEILNESCNICMEKFLVGQYKRCLPNCKHLFHKKCIDRWLKKNASCPICRNTLKESEGDD